MKVKYGRLAAAIVILLAIPAIWASVVTLSFENSGRMCKGAVISGIRVGGLSKAEAKSVVQDWARAKLKDTITLTAMDRRWKGTASDFGAQVKWQEAVEKAYGIGRNGSFIDRMFSVLLSDSIGKNMDANIIVKEPVLKKNIRKIARIIDQPHKDARLTNSGGCLQVVQDSCGIKLDRAKAIRQLKNAIINEKTHVALPVTVDRPDVTAGDAAGINTLLASYTTSFNSGRADRSYNLLLASRAINGVILKPNQVFSYNDTVGPRVESKGYRNSPIFVKGKLEDGIGGGICQVSSTLYNAVLLSGMRVLQRSHHSRTVVYVPPGLDATVAYGSRDFKFRNTNSSAVAVLARIGRSHLTIQIYGSACDKKNIDIYTGDKEYAPFGEETVVDNTLAPGVKKVTDKGSRGVRVTVYRKIFRPNGTAVTQTVSRDIYQPQNKVWSIGPRQKKADDVSLEKKL